MNQGKPIHILLVEDNPGDVRLTQDALKAGKVNNTLHVSTDGAAALAYLRRESGFEDAARPDLILLDLNLPKLDGREVLAKIKDDEDLRRIPVVIMTSSEDEQDIVKSYEHHANCYLTKPIDVDDFIAMVRSIEDFWLTIVRLPPGE